MKRLAFCFDGTWNKIDSQHPTNVARIAQSVSRFHGDGSPQLIYYDEGVGTSATDRLTGGMFGHGLIDKVTRAYHFLVLNYEPGDQIYVFGFSRGAFSARSFVGLIRNCGIMSRRSLGHIRSAIDLYLSRTRGSKPGSERARQFRMRHCPKLCLPGDLEWRRKARPDLDHTGLTELRVDYLGVWDTVGSLGVPNHIRALAWINRKYGFHDTELSSFVKRARHAVAADEQRRTFEPGMWSNLDDLNSQAGGDDLRYEQVIFPGTHSAVGGGGPIRGLSDAALDWIFGGARMAGLAFDQDDQSPVYQLRPDHRAQLFNQTGKSGWSLKDWLMGIGIATRKFPDMDRRGLHDMVVRRFAASPSDLPERKAYRPQSLEAFWSTLEEMAAQDAAAGQLRRASLSTSDPRALRAPDRVRKYMVKAGDTLTEIAEREMGGKSHWQLLSQHNRNVGYLFEDDEIYAGSVLEIPEYDEPRAPAAPQPVALDGEAN